LIAESLEIADNITVSFQLLFEKAPLAGIFPRGGLELPYK
jgi:hypothetical protein